ncbi:MAG TPA: hypothetical protein VD994_04025 [Prosthecobacter sp.]|nr:hypothetical protein [Prosthecobacter sp.]
MFAHCGAELKANWRSIVSLLASLLILVPLGIYAALRFSEWLGITEEPRQRLVFGAIIILACSSWRIGRGEGIATWLGERLATTDRATGADQASR